MIPSRGLRGSIHTTGLNIRRIESSAIRQFSSNSISRSFRNNTVLSRNGESLTKPIARPQFSNINRSIRNGAAIRFASTTPTTIPIAESPPSITPDSAFQSTPLDDATDFQSDLLNIPEHIGYLKELGLDYGYGPTSIVEWTLEHIHVLAGTPWWVSIALSAVAWRLVLIKPFLDAAENASRMAAIKHITAPIQAEMTAAQKAGDTHAVLTHRAELKRIFKRAGVSMWKGLLPLTQVFIGFGTWKLLRAMSDLPIPGLLDGGILWFYNLTIPDPFLILPTATAGILHLVLRKGGETGVTNFTPQMHNIIMWALPGVSLVFTAFMPAAVQLSFLVSSLLSAAQATIFRNPSFRAWADMTPLPTAPTTYEPPRLKIKMADDPTTIVTEPVKRTRLDGTVKSIMSGFEAAKNSATAKLKERSEEARIAQEKKENAKLQELYQKRLAEQRLEERERKQANKGRRRRG